MGADRISFECYPTQYFQRTVCHKMSLRKKEKKTKTDLSVMFC